MSGADACGQHAVQMFILYFATAINPDIENHKRLALKKYNLFIFNVDAFDQHADIHVDACDQHA
ncbi:MAG: hypothetical protein ABI851_07440 [Saprospiraceae bacterium]